MLRTRWIEKMTELPWDEYPRPSLKRDSFLCLNGQWDFAFSREEMSENWQKISVPFCPESDLSGINKSHEEGENLLYRRRFSLPEGFVKDRVILHFGGCDQECKVFVNGREIGTHRGGYLPFGFDITEWIHNENTILVVARDDGDTFYPWGKQRKKRGGMWYTKVSGIWQTVWLESVPKRYIESIRFTPTEDGVYVNFQGVDRIALSFDDLETEEKYQLADGDFLKVKNPVLWSPENPNLYHVTVSSGEDVVKTYFALRTVSVEKIGEYPRILLNGRPYFFHGLLDQGYWPDGIFLPPTPEALLEELKEIKALGFNMVRKHIKIEPEIFYYYCDTLGIAVFQDMVNSGEYRFFHDTALPTIGFKSLKDWGGQASAESKEAFFIEHCKDTVSTLYNHPSIVYWTIFNEGWGQFKSDMMYAYFKEWDKTRIIDSTSGWFRQKKSDVESIHVYFKKVKPIKSDRPIALTEFGGYALSLENHVFNTKKEFGYKKFSNMADLSEAIIKLYEEEVLPYIPLGLCVAVYTQVSDVEDETNGIFTYDRKVCKVSKEGMLKLSEKLCRGNH